MSVGVRVAAFAALLALVFAAAALAGRALDPSTGSHEEAAAEHAHGHEATAPAAAAVPAGLSLAQDGLRLEARDTPLFAGRPSRLEFRIAGAGGRTVRDFATEQGRRMHLIVVRRDLTGYQHLHPTQTPTGAWTVPITLPGAGAYRAFADFSTGGRRLTLGIDRLVPGQFAPRPLPAPAESTRVDGYDVAIHAHGAGSELGFTITRDGTPVTDLQPYLGARGHLVALRAGDLAYEHVHPIASGTSNEISFETAAPTPGSYRLFLQFRHGDRVHTAAFTRTVSP
jgi:hypothetical protein